RGDFDVRVDYQLLTWPAGNEVRLGMMMFGDTIGYANMVRCSSTEELYIADFYGAPLPSPRVTTTDMSGKLRLTRQGTTIIGYYYQSGAWVSLYSKVVTNADLGVSLRAWSHDTIFPDKEAKVAFDNFQILQGSLVPAVPAIPEPSSLLALASGLMALGLVRRRLSSK
ncbi:MAG TPA: PEP-CTERM sorting domain-containing protein, partial [Armatimonadota bacterium]|nr:PEP-CTERM sorting domain-containing protein [Armatimonadota bacterium]